MKNPNYPKQLFLYMKAFVITNLLSV